jgi:hypothetical protein
MAEFMLLLHENPQGFAELSPKEIQNAVGEYSAWREQIAGKGRLTGGNKLRDEGGRWLTSDAGDVRVVDGPFSEAKEVIGGYFMIKAADYDEAVEISRGCPHLCYGGRIELREVDPLND